MSEEVLSLDRFTVTYRRADTKGVIGFTVTANGMTKEDAEKDADEMLDHAMKKADSLGAQEVK